MGLWRAGGGHRRVLCCCGWPKSPCPVSRLSWQPSTGLWQCHRAGRASPAESGPCQVCHLWPCSVFMDYRNVELSWQLQLFLWFSCWSHRTRNWECAPSCGCHSCPVLIPVAATDVLCPLPDTLMSCAHSSGCHTHVLCWFLWLPHSCPVLRPVPGGPQGWLSWPISVFQAGKLQAQQARGADQRCGFDTSSFHPVTVQQEMW